MASFSQTDSTNPQFSPYVNTVPNDALYRVGVLKQQDYDQGLQKAQSYISSVAGLPIAKSDIKDYIQQKLDGVKEGLTKNIAGDFSDERLVNQIGGAASEIYTDPVVQNGVQATAAIQSAQQQMADDEKAGKLSPANQYAFDQPLNQWMNDGKVNTKLNASYSTDWDIDGKIKGALDDAHKNGDIDEKTWDEDVLDANGNVDPRALIEKSSKGMSSQKVQDIISTITSQPGAANQMNINAQYLYRGMGPSQLLDEQSKSLNEYQSNYEGKRQQLQMQWNASNPIQRGVIQQQINDLDGEYKTVSSNYSDAKDALTNPTNQSVEQARNSLYQANLTSRYANAYHWDVESQKIVDNPLFKAQMDINKFTLDKQKFDWDKQYQGAQLGLDQSKLNEEIRKDDMENDREYLALGLKYDKLTGKTTSAGDPNIAVGDWNTIGVNTDYASTLGPDTYQHNLIDPTDKEKTFLEYKLLDKVQSKTFANGTPAPSLFKLSDDGTSLVPNVDPTGKNGGFQFFKDWQQGYKRALQTLNLNQANGTLPVELQGYADKWNMDNNKLKVLNDNKTAADNVLNNALTGVISKLKNSGLPQQFTFGTPSKPADISGYSGPSFQYSLSSAIDIEMLKKYGQESNEGKGAYNRLVGALGQTNADLLVNNQTDPDAVAANKSAAIFGDPEEKARMVIQKEIGSDPSLEAAVNKRNQMYSNMQTGFERKGGLINTSTEERRTATNNEFSTVVANQARRSGSVQIVGKGSQSDLQDWLENKPDNLGKNTYSVEKSDDGSQLFTITRNEGSKPQTISFKVDPDDISNVQGAVIPETPYMQDVKTFLGVNNNRSTTSKDLNSSYAASTAIPLPQGSNIGNYHVGYQLEQVGGGYTVHLYITDNQTGKPLATGIKFQPTAGPDNTKPTGIFPLENLEKTLYSLDPAAIYATLKMNGLTQ